MSFGAVVEISIKHYKDASMRNTKGKCEKDCITKLIWWTIQCTTMIMEFGVNGTYHHCIWIITLDLRPWKVLTPLVPKHTNLEVRSSSYKPPCVIKKFMINKIRLATLDLESTCFTFDNKGMWHQSWTIKPYTLAQLNFVHCY